MTRGSRMPELQPPVGAHDHVQGPATAPVTLVEYADYECPYSGKAHPVVQEIQRRLGDRLRFVYRNFPLTEIHPHAGHAAEAAEAAAAQGQFWPMHDYLFAHQAHLEDADLRGYAAHLGLDVARFDREMGAHAYARQVGADIHSGDQSGVQGTPTFFINGVLHNASWELAPLLAAIEHAA